MKIEDLQNQAWKSLRELARDYPIQDYELEWFERVFIDESEGLDPFFSLDIERLEKIIKEYDRRKNHL